MTWHWKPTEACDLDELVDDLNIQLKDLGKNLGITRPELMVGYPYHAGAFVDNDIFTVPANTNPAYMKEAVTGQSLISVNGGFRVTAAGSAIGTGTKDVNLYWASNLICPLSVGAGTKSWCITADVWNLGTNLDQRWLAIGYDGTTIEVMSIDTVALTITTSQTFQLIGQKATAGDTLKTEMWVVEVFT